MYACLGKNNNKTAGNNRSNCAAFADYILEKGNFLRQETCAKTESMSNNNPMKCKIRFPPAIFLSIFFPKLFGKSG